ncbi:MAG: hypothetical protein R3282_06480, partial [Rhodothermales bacterium]|nr:hypothetical protein [Rhodothermales bacterium]
LQEKYDGFDPVIQMQVDQFAKHLVGATGGTCGICIVDKNGIAQIAMHTRGDNRDKAQANATLLLMMAADGALKNASNGVAKLMVHFADGTVYPATGDKVVTEFVRDPK